jgi:hypothetical protein
MIKEFVPYEWALELRKLGFDEPCLRVGNPNGHTMWKWIEVDEDTQTVSIDDVLNVEYMEGYIQIPTRSQAFRFFREKYNLHSEILLDQTTQPKYCFEIHKYEDFGNYEEIRIGEWFLYRTFEEAELACLVNLIDIVKIK